MRRRYFLGGSVAGGRWYSADSFVPIIIVVMVVAGLTVVAMATMGPGGAGVILAISAVVFFLATKKDSLGIAPIAGLQGQVTRWVLKRAGWNSFDPDTEDMPVALGRVRALAWSAAEGRPEVALLEHIDEGYISATILLRGEVKAMISDLEDNAKSSSFGAFLKGLADGQMPITQVDLTIRATPGDSTEYLDYMDRRQRKNTLQNRHIPERLVEATTALAGAVDVADEYQAWATFKMPTEGLARRATLMRLEPGFESIAASAYEVAGEAATRLTIAGLRPTFGLPPKSLAALLRHMMVPVYRARDLGGLERVWDGVRYGYDLEERGMGLRVVDPSVDPNLVAPGETAEPDVWYHAIGRVPVDGWPRATLDSGWLHELIVGTNVDYRTVSVSFPLVGRAQASRSARAAVANAGAEQLVEARQGKVSSGVEAEKENAARWMLQDINDGAAGVTPSLRVMVSSPDPIWLVQDRSMVEAAMTSLGCVRWAWYDGDHARALMTMLPLARGSKGI